MNRARFPGLDDEWVRLDGPGGSQVLHRAAAAVVDYLASSDVANVHGRFAASRTTDEIVMNARRSVARLFGTAPHNVVFGPSMTTLTYRFSRAVARTLRPGDEIVCTVLDHDANVAPWRDAAAQAGARVLFAEPEPDTLDLPIASYEAVVGEHTRWIATTAASNVVGTVPDLAQVARLARDAGARVFVDAVHAIPHGPADIGAWGCDAVVTSAYKWYAPHVAALAMTDEVLDTVRPQRLRPAPARGVESWEHGALPAELLAGVAEAADYVSELDPGAISRHEATLLARLSDGLSRIGAVTMYGAPRHRTPTIAFNLKGRNPHEVAAALGRHRIAAWSGDFYAVELFRHLGIESAVRVGALHYNTVAEIDRFLDTLATIADA